MGADYLQSSIPDADITEDRRLMLLCVVDGLTEADMPEWMDDIDYYKDEMKATVERLADGMGNRRDVGCDHSGNVPLLVTGGMSWGDDPTEAFGDFDRINNCEPIRSLLALWAMDNACCTTPNELAEVLKEIRTWLIAPDFDGDTVQAFRDLIDSTLAKHTADTIRTDADKPWQVLSSHDGVVYAAGPFATEEEAMQFVDDNRLKDGSDLFEFDLASEYVYLQGPDRQLQSLSNSDFND